MDFKSVLLVLLLLTLASCSLAESQWMTFWPASSDNSVRYNNARPGHPKSNAEFEALLKQEGHYVSVSQNRQIGTQGHTWFWTALLDEDNEEDYWRFDMLEFIKTHPAANDDVAIALKTSNATVAYPRRPRRLQSWKRDIVGLSGAPRQLRFVSMPRRKNNLLDSTTTYYYDKTAGEGIRVYVMGSGLNPESDEWASTTGRSPAWLHPGPFPNDANMDVDQHSDGYGSCMADIAVGYRSGVAREADITAVLLNSFAVENAFVRGFRYEHEVDGLSKILDDIFGRPIPSNAVVLMAYTLKPFENDEYGDVFQEMYTTLLRELDARGVTLVAAMEKGAHCHAPPCQYGDPNNPDHLPGLITVGEGVINDGSYGWVDNNNERETWITVYGTGDDRSLGGPGSPGIQCARQKGKDFKMTSGVGAAAASVAGLMAYYRGLGLNAAQAKAQLVIDSYKRNANGPNMIWNGIDAF